jgi:hypothetical protein
MTIHVFTSFTFSYLSRARVLARSLRHHHPDWVIWAAITDRAPEGFTFDITAEPFDRVIWTHELFGKGADAWVFGHDIVEACTAVKGKVMARLLEEPDCEQAFYFDPDIALFAPVTGMIEALREPGTSILLTPHQLEPDTARQAVIDNEIGSLAHGVFNLGFIAVRNDDNGRAFATWWAERLTDWCHDDLPRGLFTDQKWCNLIPCFFDGVRIIRDPGCNVASWNLSRRRVDITGEGDILVNGSALKFYHFTKMGPVGDVMTQRYAGSETPVYELWVWYKRAVAAEDDARIPPRWWYYGTFGDGLPVPRSARKLYRERIDLRRAFPNPLEKGRNSFAHWVAQNTDLLVGEVSIG